MSDRAGYHALCDTTLYVVSAEEILIPRYFLRARRECLWGFEITSLRSTQAHANIHKGVPPIILDLLFSRAYIFTVADWNQEAVLIFLIRSTTDD